MATVLYSHCILSFPHSSWFIDNTTNPTTVTYLLTGANLPPSNSDILYHYSYEPCPRSGCPSPPRPGGPIDVKLVTLYTSFTTVY